ncbi:MAG: bacillithiol biosynthesis deacetylase BshB1 [marine benthic group bacterium]|jgi:bacillithiol biosynthesis deacetylase BshB1|nr:bacillithiol biosynthesis deacetylase BshB1 [Candidatus Benthicola marisminoris]
MKVQPVDVLAIGPHPDDAELLCGGTLARCADQGHRTAILDLTRGETGTRGTPETRAEEAAKAAQALGLSTRENAELPDADIRNDRAARECVVGWLRKLKPRVVILPYLRGRHPDHRVAAELCRDACFLSGLARFGEGPVHRPHKVVYALAFREDPVKPTFVVDISEQFAAKLEAIRAYSSQFDGVVQAGEAFPTGQPLYDLVESQSRHYGSLIRREYGEPFYTEETVEIDDLASMRVRSI